MNKYIFKRRTKIVCTIGPATGSASMIERLIKSGMNVARLNLSHGTQESHLKYLHLLRSISNRLNMNIAIMMDLPGPKYRTGKLKNEKIRLVKNAKVIITTRDILGDDSLVPVNFSELPKDVRVSDTVLIDDGAIQLRVLEKSRDEVICKVIEGGILTEGRGLVVPGMKTSHPFITDKLREYLLFAIEQKPDYIALSFVSNAGDVNDARSIMQEKGIDIPLISKIERIHAVNDLDAILTISDGIMVARGDLGVDIPLENVPLVQKEIIRKCNHAGKPVITATQMLESMINAARPTRAEVSDVANAIFDGSDAIMLSAETSVGKYPLQSIKTMSKVAVTTERKLPHLQILQERSQGIERQTDELISYSACNIANRLNVKAIVALTRSGSTARRVSKYRPCMPILAITPDEGISGRMILQWGVYPYLIKGTTSLDDLFKVATKLVLDLKIAGTGDLIVITGGIPVGIAGTTNLLKVHKVE